MKKVFTDYRFAAVLAALITELANIFINFYPVWICYVSLMLVLQKESPRNCFRAGFIFGFTMSVISFYWIIPGAQRFTGSSSIYGIIVFLLSTILMSFYYAGINYTFSILKAEQRKSFSFILNALLIASVYVMGEELITFISKGMPWFGFHSGTGLLSNLYAIQPAAYVGIHGISFFVVLINYIVAYYILQKQWIKLSIPFIMILAYMVSGYLIFNDFNENRQNGKPFNMAILSENIAPEIRWDDNTGDMLVHKILDLDSIAATNNPNVILWSESAVPWTYKPDDDLVNELLRITKSKNITHILGINTDFEDNIVYNSAYSLRPDGNIDGRYDKRFLLSFIEEGIGGMIIPFFSSSGFFVKEGESDKPINTPYGKAGVMICNESTVPAAAASMVKNGAEFLVNLSNDGWFSDTYIVDLHLYNVRLRAVETRKDIAVNSNRGYSGMIDANGTILLKERSDNPFVKMVSITPNNFKTPAVSMPSILIMICLLYISSFVMLFVRKKTMNK